MCVLNEILYNIFKLYTIFKFYTIFFLLFVRMSTFYVCDVCMCAGMLASTHIQAAAHM